MQIAVLLFDGFDNLDAIGPFEVFSHAINIGAELEVGFYTLTRQEVITSSHGLRIEPDGFLNKDTKEDALQTEKQYAVFSGIPDIVIVPGGGWGNRAEEGTWAEVQRGDLPNALAQLYDNGAVVASVCTGGMLLAHAGLVDNRPAVTHQDSLADLRDIGADVIEARVVDDGDILTAGGVTAGIDLALHLLERNFGTDLAKQVAAVMEYEPTDGIYEST